MQKTNINFFDVENLFWRVDRCTPDILYTYGWNFSGRTEHEFDVIFFVFSSAYLGNLEVCYTKTFDIFWKYISATSSTYLCFGHSSIGGLFNYPYIFPFLKK